MKPKWIAVVLGFSALFFIGISSPRDAHAATLYLSPDQKSLTAGQTFVVTVLVSSPDQAMNAVSGDISFPTDKLRVISISQTDSIINFWVQNPTFSNSAGGGDITFQGVVLSPGFIGSSGSVLKITLQAVTAGSASLTFSSGSILANNGNGTNILSSSDGATFVVVSASSIPESVNKNLPSAPVVSSVTHPDKNQWYNGKTLQFSWTIPSDVDGVSYALYSTSDFVLPSTSDGLPSSISYDLTSRREGKWYFYIKFHNESGWGPTTMRSVRIDFSPPEPFSITYSNDGDLTNPRPSFTWSTTDALSGIEKYLVRIGNGNWFDASTIVMTSTVDQYQLPLQSPQQNALLTVDAYDYAGNITEATTTFTVAPLPSPIINSYTKNIPASRPIFAVQGSVQGISSANMTVVNIYLQKSVDVVKYSVPVDQNGNWSFDQTLNLPAGSWTLTAQTSDDRGALSASTSPIAVSINGWLSGLLDILFSWTAAIVAGILLVAIIITVVYLLVHHMRRLRLSLSKKLIREEKDFHDDLVRIEKELEIDHAGEKIDLSVSGMRKKKELIRKEIEHLDEDIKKDLEDMK